MPLQIHKVLPLPSHPHKKDINMRTRNLCPLLLPLILSGCMGIYEGGFECPPGVGTKCKSISEVNELINNGALPFPTEEVPGESCASGACCKLQQGELPASHIWWAPWAFEDGGGYPDGSI